jgi:hypothetical protein
MLRDTAFLARGPDRVYIGIGTAELDVRGGDQYTALLRTTMTATNDGLVRMAETLANNFRAAFINRPYVTLTVEPEGRHRSESWARRFPQAAAALFGAQK